jgi:ABC-type antimicrobial peptide transport system ATPase subunit
MAILEVSCLKKIYTSRFGANQVQALTNVSFSVEQGEYVAIMGEDVIIGLSRNDFQKKEGHGGLVLFNVTQ